MDERTTPQGRLAALGAHMGARKFDVELLPDGLRLTNPRISGCCDDVRHAADTIACRSRAEDGGALWFFTSWGDPVARADRVTDAAVVVQGYLGDHTADLNHAGPHTEPGTAR